MASNSTLIRNGNTESKNKLSEQILLFFALHGIPEEEIPLETNINPIRKMWGLVRERLSEHRRTENLIKKAAHYSSQISKTLPMLGIQRVLPQDLEKLKFFFKDFRWKCRTIISNKQPSLPSHKWLDMLTKDYIIRFNTFIKSLENQWIYQYGTIDPSKLQVRDPTHLAEIINHALVNKLVHGEDKRLAEAFVNFTAYNAHLSNIKTIVTSKSKDNYTANANEAQGDAEINKQP